MRIATVVVALLLMAISLAGCTDGSGSSDDGMSDEDNMDQTSFETDAPKGTPPAGGGGIGQVPPVFNLVALSSSVADNSGGSATTLTMELYDANGEQDFADGVLTVAVTGTVTDSRSITLPPKGSWPVSEPATFDAQGWKVWDSGASLDGVVTVQLQYTVPVGTVPGVATLTPTIDPKGGGVGGTPVTGISASLTIDVFSEITLSGIPVFGNGTLDNVGSWGGWTALPGATNVPSLNFFQLENTGQDPNAQLIIDFSGTGFVGATEGVEIPIANNIEFAWVELPVLSIPDDGVYNFQPANSEGSVTVQFSGLGNVIFVMYRIVEMPSVLPEDNYGASFTVTEL